MSHRSTPRYTPPVQLDLAAMNFHSLSSQYSDKLCLTSSGGTANVAVGMLASEAGISFNQAMTLVDFTGGPTWYSSLLWTATPVEFWEELAPMGSVDLVVLMDRAIDLSREGIKLQHH